MSIYKRPGSPCWYYNFTIQGHRVRGSCGTTARAEAREVEEHERAKAFAELRLGRKPHLTLSQALGRFLSDHAERLPSADTIQYQSAKLLRHLGKRIDLCQIDDARLAEFVARRRAEVSDSTVNRELTLLRAVMRMARDRWGIDTGLLPAFGRHRLREPAPRDIRDGFRGACRRAGLTDFRFHDLRHTSASWLVQADTPLDVVQSILGHRSLITTQRYAHRAAGAKRAALEAAFGDEFPSQIGHNETDHSSA